MENLFLSYFVRASRTTRFALVYLIFCGGAKIRTYGHPVADRAGAEFTGQSSLQVLGLDLAIAAAVRTADHEYPVRRLIEQRLRRGIPGKKAVFDRCVLIKNPHCAWACQKIIRV